MVGMTRLEISYCFGKTNDYIFGLPFMKHNFKDQASTLLKEIIDDVLNEK
jgi:hypothetical protein